MRVLDVDAPAAPETMVHGLLMPARNSRPSILGYAWLIIRFDRTLTSLVDNYAVLVKVLKAQSAISLNSALTRKIRVIYIQSI